ncbi:MAG TPA: hypothetical protein VMH01_10600 [Puia sp.]|nr:hypothetical protein [Puia sp.]
MNTVLTNDEKKLLDVKYLPAVSIILPFEPKMSLKKELQYKLKIMQAKVEKELVSNYPSEKGMPIIQKLQRVIKNVNYFTHKKSLAIFVSPIVEKVFYLDIPVEERIVIDESFEIRDLVYSKKQTIQYLILLLSGKSSKTYLGNCSKFILIKSNIPDNVYAYERDMPQKVTHFSDPHEHKEIVLDNFLRHMDEGLSLILNAYPLPVFVMGAERTLGHFRKITKNEKSILQYIHGNYEEATESEIRQVIKPYVADWNKVKQQNSLLQIEKAMSDGKLVYGIKDVWEAATHKNCHLLIVEKDFIYAAHQGAHPDEIYKEDLNLNNPFYIKDAVDDVMEKVLEAGGDVEFVDNGVLKDYNHIALIRYY